jgi:hypothetical protein
MQILTPQILEIISNNKEEILPSWITKNIYAINDMYNKEDYKLLNTILSDLIESDCHAVTVDNEIVYNGFDIENMSFIDSINEKLIRNRLISNIHSSLLIKIHRNKNDCIIRIFMFSEQTWFVEAKYVHEYELYILKCFRPQC